MKVLLLELSSTDSVARLPSRYGGAGPTFRHLAENIPNVFIGAEESCFENDLTEKCIPIDNESVRRLRDGGALNHNAFASDNWGIVVHANSRMALNTEIPQLVWAVGQNEHIHPHIKHLLIHNLKWQRPVIQNVETKIHEFVLGINIPQFQTYEKEDLVFSCGNQYPQVNSHILAQWAIRNQIKVIFAGPIDKIYQEQFLRNVDYNWAIYIGQIAEGEKIKLMKKALIYVDLPSHNLNGPRLSVKQAWSYGCSVISSPMGIMPEVVKNGINGFIIGNEMEFVKAVVNSKNINQKDCWDTANQWHLEKMILSFMEVISNVMKD